MEKEFYITKDFEKEYFSKIFSIPRWTSYRLTFQQTVTKERKKKKNL